MTRIDSDAEFDRLCQRLNDLRVVDIPNLACPVAVVRVDDPIAWFEDFQAASTFARARYLPDTYAIGDPTAEPDFLPMFFVRQPIA